MNQSRVEKLLDELNGEISKMNTSPSKDALVNIKTLLIAIQIMGDETDPSIVMKLDMIEDYIVHKKIEKLTK